MKEKPNKWLKFEGIEYRENPESGNRDLPHKKVSLEFDSGYKLWEWQRKHGKVIRDDEGKKRQLKKHRKAAKKDAEIGKDFADKLVADANRGNG